MYRAIYTRGPRLDNTWRENVFGAEAVVRSLGSIGSIGATRNAVAKGERESRLLRVRTGVAWKLPLRFRLCERTISHTRLHVYARVHVLLAHGTKE